MRVLGAGGLLALVAMVGCGGQGEIDPAFRSGSSNVAMSADEQTLWVADADNGAIATIHLDDPAAQPDVLPVGLEPTRLVRVGDRLFVTLRAEGVVAVVQTDTQQVVERIEVGPEPYGIVASPDGRKVYVAVSTADVVVEIDTATFELGKKFPVPGQPRWLAMHPAGRFLFVGSAYEGGLWRVNVSTEEVKPLGLPDEGRGTVDTGSFDTGSRHVVPLRPRITGDPVISQDGDRLAVPILFVDPGEDDGSSTSIGSSGLGRNSRAQYYTSGDVQGLTRFNPAVTVFALGASGAPVGEPHAMLVTGTVSLKESNHTRYGASLNGTGQLDARKVRGYLSSLAFSPNGHMVLASIEGGSTVAIVSSEPVVSGTPRGDFDDFFFGDGAFESTPRILVGTGEGPQGLAVAASGHVYGYAFLDRTVHRIDLGQAYDTMGELLLGDASELAFGSAAEATWREPAVTTLAPSALPAEVQAGRRLFYSSSNPTMAAEGAGVSCSTCHFDGRNDGLTWHLEHGGRQTPSLAGHVSETTPVTWTEGVGTVAEEARLTSMGRMGGNGPTEAERDAIAAFIDSTRAVQLPPVDAAAAARGKAIFERDDTACSTCHSGERLTDNQAHDMLGTPLVNTPTLTGIAATAPYFHDARAATLADVIELADDVGMGHTSQLSADEKADLETYLRSL